MVMGVENRRRSLRWEKLAAVVAVICILMADRGISAPDGRGTPAGEKLELFDGKSKVIIVNGYSTSFRWKGGISGKINRYVATFISALGSDRYTAN